MNDPGTSTDLRNDLRGLERLPGEVGYHFTVFNKAEESDAVRITALSSISACAQSLDDSVREQISSVLLRLARDDHAIGVACYQETATLAPSHGQAFKDLAIALRDLPNDSAQEVLHALSCRSYTNIQAESAVELVLSLAKLAEGSNNHIRYFALSLISNPFLASDGGIEIVRYANRAFPTFLEPRVSDPPFAAAMQRLVHGVVIEGKPYETMRAEFSSNTNDLLFNEALFQNESAPDVEDDRLFCAESVLQLVDIARASPDAPYDAIKGALDEGSRLVFCPLFLQNPGNASAFTDDLVTLLSERPELIIVSVCSTDDEIYFRALASAESSERSDIRPLTAMPPFRAIGSLTFTNKPEISIGEMFRSLLATGKLHFVSQPDTLQGELQIDALTNDLSRICRNTKSASAIILCSFNHGSKSDDPEFGGRLSLSARCPGWTKPVTHLIADWDRLRFAEEHGIHNLIQVGDFGISGAFTLVPGAAARAGATVSPEFTTTLGIGEKWDAMLVYGTKGRPGEDDTFESPSKPNTPSGLKRELITSA